MRLRGHRVVGEEAEPSIDGRPVGTLEPHNPYGGNSANFILGKEATYA